MKKLSRRQLVMGLGAAGAGAMLPSLVAQKREAAAISPKPFPSCTLTPEQTEGPFYFDTKLIRRNITEGRPGKTLVLKLKVVESGSCEPIRDAVVDIWSCDAMGEYSGFESARGASRRGRDNEKTFLRGAQVTDASGEVEFETIYPGWYQGRATHIHIKVYLENDEVLTSQMYFPEDINENVYQEGVYVDHEGRRLRNSDDGIFNRGGKGPMLELAEIEEGFVGTMTLGVDRS